MHEQADSGRRFPLLESASEEERLEGLRQLLSRGPPDLDAVLAQVASRDDSARIRYAARKALALRERARAGGAAAPAKPASPVPAREPPSLAEALRSAVPAERLTAAQQASKAATSREVQAAREQLAVEPDAGVRARLVSVLERFGAATDIELLIPLLRDADNRVRANAVLAAAAADLTRAAPHLMTLLADADHRVRANCTLSLSTLGEDQVLLCLERMLGEDSVAMRDAAAFALAGMPSEAALPLLRRAMTDKSPMVREKAQGGLQRLADAGNAEAARLLAALAHGEPVPQEAVDVVGAVEDLPVGPEKLADPNPKVRIRALTEAIADKRRDLADEIVARLEVEANEFVLSKVLVAVGELGETEHGSAVKRLLVHSDPRVVSNAIEALTRLKAYDRAAAVRPLLSLRNGRARAAATIFMARADRSFDALDAVRKMLTAHEWDLRLAGVHALALLDLPDSTLLLEPLLSDFSAAVREKAFQLLETRARRGDEMAKDLIEMCRQGFVERKERSLKLVPAPRAKRLLAFYADLFALALLTMPAWAGAYWVISEVGLRAGVIALALSTVMLGVLFFVKDGLRGGRGIGKGSAGLRVVDLERYAACSRAKSLLRQAMLGVPILNLIEAGMVLVRRDGRRLADLLLNTQVVDEEQRPLTVAEHLVLWVFTAAGVALIVFVQVAQSSAQQALLRSQGMPSVSRSAAPRSAALQLPNADWRVASRFGRRATLKHKTSSGLEDADLTIDWREYRPRRKQTGEEGRRAEVEGVTSLMAATLGGKGSRNKESNRRVLDFADGLGAAFDTELAVRQVRVHMRCYVWSKEQAVVTARLMSMESRALDGLEADVQSVIESAGRQPLN